MQQKTQKLVLAGIFIALGLVLPIAFHGVGMAGDIFLPMHIPILLCGLLCGYRLGGIVGLLIPLLSSLFFGMPPMYPVAIYMACELIAYGVVAGLLVKKTNIIIALLGAMLAGRVALGLAQMLLLGFGSEGFSWQVFLTGAFVTALPGIVLQLVLIPLLLAGLKRANLRIS